MQEITTEGASALIAKQMVTTQKTWNRIHAPEDICVDIFDKRLLYNVKREHSSVLTCKDCAKTAATYKCDACTERKKEELFDVHVFGNAEKHNRLRVCLACQQRGFSPKDCEEYMCTGCEKGWGHLHYDKNRLKHAKNGKSALCCPECVERKKSFIG